jgi:hypothetical protein
MLEHKDLWQTRFQRTVGSLTPWTLRKSEEFVSAAHEDGYAANRRKINQPKRLKAGLPLKAWATLERPSRDEDARVPSARARRRQVPRRPSPLRGSRLHQFDGCSRSLIARSTRNLSAPLLCGYSRRLRSLSASLCLQNSQTDAAIPPRDRPSERAIYHGALDHRVHPVDVFCCPHIPVASRRP